ncbi:MAG: hypothetical protein WCH52_00145 [Bacteroidota bacterium]
MNFKSMRLIYLLCFAGFFYISCSKESANSTGSGGGLPTHYIKILDDSVSPAYLKVAQGSTITFVNLSSISQTMVSDNCTSLNTPLIAPANFFIYKKDTVGIISYHSLQHPLVRGIIEIRP